VLVLGVVSAAPVVLPSSEPQPATARASATIVAAQARGTLSEAMASGAVRA
jgi:hypothetical protein